LNDLADDQSQGFAFYNKQEDEIQFYVRSKNSTVNDIAIIYDIIKDNRYIDNNKYYSGITELNSNYYAGSNLASVIYQDNIGTEDDGD
jgi:hypothetical protein